MNALTINIPDSLYNKLKELTQKDRVSLEDFAVSAVAEKLASFLTVDYIEHRAKRANIDRFHEILAKIPSIEPDEEDRL